jgi:KDO2-lipid IV(A) lauroyltransferase
MRGLVLRTGLHAADLVARLLPSWLAYGLADLLGRAWHRFAPGRRAVVAENLARIQAWRGGPTDGRAFQRLVELAFVEHARYWLEVFRLRHYPEESFERMLRVDGWDELRSAFGAGLIVAVPHMGNFEPFAHFMASHGISGMSPVEETKPKELYDFLVTRRLVGGLAIRLVPLSQAVRPMLAALRDGEIVALAAERDLAGDGVPVTMFGHPTTLPTGPATLALRTGRPLYVARALREGPDRFSATAWPVSVEPSGNRRADVETVTRALAEHFERIIAEAPEQWFGAFQPYWTDQRS